MLEKMGSKVHITPERLDSTEEQFRKRGKSIVLVRFFIPVLPWSAGIFAGIARMPRGTLFLFNFIAITLWALIELTIVAFFSSALKDVLSRFSMAGAFWLATGIIGLFLLMRLFRRRRAARRAQLDVDADAELEPFTTMASEAVADSGEPTFKSPAVPVTTSSELPPLDVVKDKPVPTPGAAAGSSVPPGPD